MAPGAKTVATFDEDSNIRVWSATTGQELLKFAGTTRDLRFLAFSPDGKRCHGLPNRGGKTRPGADYTTFITDSYVRLWDVAKREMVQHIEAHPKGIGSIRFAPDSQSIYTGGYGLDPFIRRWDVKTGKKLLELPRQGNAITTLDISADGQASVRIPMAFFGSGTRKPVRKSCPSRLTGVR